MIQSREQRLAQLARERDQRQSKALAYDALADVIRELPVPVHAYGKHWRAIARVLHEDSVRLMTKAMDIQDRIADLERARDAAETHVRTTPEWNAMPLEPEPEQPTVMTVAQLLAEDE